MVKKYLWQHPDGRWYVRIKGKYHRIEAENGTADFDRQYWEILTGKRAEVKTSWKALVASYRRSDRWTGLKPRTRADYEKVLAYVLEKIGARDVRRLTRRDVIKAMEANVHRVRFANYIPAVLSVLLEHAIDIGWTGANPAKGVRKLKTPDDRKQEHVPWTDDAVRRFRAEAAPLALLIFEIGVGSVQRPGDWPTFRWNHYSEGALDVSQGKTGRALWLPCTPELRAALDAAPRRGLTILAKPDGSPMTYHYISRVMRAERKRLGLERYDLHAMRYRGVMELAWAGCDDDEIMSYSGHGSKAMVIKYAGAARQIMRARSAAEKRRVWASL